MNYQKSLDEIIEGLPKGSRPRLMLHVCCAPCASYVLEYLCAHFDVTALFYNPNIRPGAEYEKRLGELRRLVALRHAGLRVVESGYLPESFDLAEKGLENEPEGALRCSVCFELRLYETARLASEEGFEWFATTLTVSPHKNAAEINKIGLAAAERHGAAWLSSDFKKRGGCKRSIELSGELSLYRQDYCGCKPR